MDDAVPFKPRTERTIIMSVLFVVLYLTSFMPVEIWQRKSLLPRWLKRTIEFIYEPAGWVTEKTLPLDMQNEWFSYWDHIVPGPLLYPY